MRGGQKGNMEAGSFFLLFQRGFYDFYRTVDNSERAGPSRLVIFAFTGFASIVT